MRAIRRFTVRTVLPPALVGLEEVAYNLRWSWSPQTRDLFAAIDPALWESCGQDPVALLGEVSSERLAELARTASMPGFRPGKAPRAVLERRRHDGIALLVRGDRVDERDVGPNGTDEAQAIAPAEGIVDLHVIARIVRGHRRAHQRMRGHERHAERSRHQALRQREKAPVLKLHGPVGVDLLDHVVVGDGKWISLKQIGAF